MNSRSAASIAPRLVAVIALGSALALGTTGCTFITHQATTNPYPASDGVPFDETGGDVVARNVFVVTTEDGEVGNLVGAFINEGSKTSTVDIDVAGEQLTGEPDREGGFTRRDGLHHLSLGTRLGPRLHTPARTGQRVGVDLAHDLSLTERGGLHNDHRLVAVGRHDRRLCLASGQCHRRDPREHYRAPTDSLPCPLHPTTPFLTPAAPADAEIS